MKPLQVLSACARPPATATSSSARQALRECMTMTCSFLREVVAMSLHLARRRIDDQTLRVLRVRVVILARTRIGVPRRERQVDVVTALVERIRRTLTLRDVGSQRVWIAADRIADREVGEDGPACCPVEGGCRQLAAALEPIHY